jgi:aldose sugar dehydrogenase
MQQQGLIWGAAFAMAASLACGGSPSPPSTGNPPPGGGDQVTGRERLGWTQTASSSADLAAFRYASYVDTNNRAELSEVSCAPSGDGFACSSRMPSMSAGSHTIELVSFVVDSGTIVESPRSAALRVTMTGSTADGPAGGSSSGSSNAADPSTGSNHRSAATLELTTRDGVRLRADVLTDQLEAPTGLGLTSDGRVFVAERTGRIRVVTGGVVSSTSQALDEVAVVGDADGGLIGLALAPDFDRTHHVYALYAVLDRDARPMFRVARFREAGGEFAERVTLLDGVPASATASGAIAIGPDGFLYVAFDDGGDPARSASPASYNAKVLRLTLEGTTPMDQPSSSPIHLSGHRSPRALDWQTASGALWVLDQRLAAAGELRGVRDSRSTKDSARTRIPLSPRLGASSMTFYDSDLMPAFRGDLLVAAGASRQLVRFRFDPRDVTRVAATEALSSDMFTGLTAVAIGPEGAIYMTTDRTLVRLAPAQ